MTEPFRVPEPSDEATEAYHRAIAERESSQGRIHAAYAVDLPAIIRQEVETALGAFVRDSKKFQQAPGASGKWWDAHGGWRRDYLAARYGEPTPAAQCPTCEGPCRVVMGEPHRKAPRPEEAQAIECPCTGRPCPHKCTIGGFHEICNSYETPCAGKSCFHATGIRKGERPEGAPEPPMSDKFAQSFDARDWAKAFVETVRKRPHLPIDESAMLAWFANALMRGWDERAWRHPDPTETTPIYSDAERAFLRAQMLREARQTAHLSIVDAAAKSGLTYDGIAAARAVLAEGEK